MSKPKQVIVIRKDITGKGNEQMGPGKLAAQVSHASIAPILQIMRGGTPYELLAPSPDPYRLFMDLEPGTALKDWIEGEFTKIILYVNSEEELIELDKKIKEAGFISCLIKDAGHTVFKEPTITCLGVEPLYPEQIDPLTGHLKLFR